MRVHLVSDVHGRTDTLPAAAEGADVLICLGDLLLFLDYFDHSKGIFAEMFGKERAAEYIGLRAAKRFAEAGEMSSRLFAARSAEGNGDPNQQLHGAIRRQYAEIFCALPEPAYLVCGNVDIPGLWPEFTRPGHHVIDAGRAEIGGLTFGFVGGGLESRYRTPNEVSEERFLAKIEAVGEVDVLCTHIPPAIPELLFDTVARRLERGSTALLEAIRRTGPRYAFFGHVHQPLARRVRVGRTECVNVGHFRATGVPYVVDL